MLYKCLHIDFKLIPDKLLDSSKTAGGAKNGFDVSLAEAKYEARLSFLLILEKKHKKSHSSHFLKKLFISSSRRSRDVKGGHMYGRVYGRMTI